jgi:hypothetical protein
LWGHSLYKLWIIKGAAVYLFVFALSVTISMKFYLLAAAVFTVASAQQYTTPVPILKQINKHNEDGSYSYGYEAADGTYKIETKYPDGEVFGKYGYVDDQGKLRTVEYGASRRGFEPAGNEIQVPPPTLKINNNYAPAKPLGPNDEDDGQYREDPSVYYKNEPYARSQLRYTAPQSIYREPQAVYEPEADYRPSYKPPAYRPPQPSYTPPQPSYTAPQPSYQPSFRPQSSFNFPSQPSYYNPPAPPAYPNYQPFQGHPATNVDIASGSYSVNYR